MESIWNKIVTTLRSTKGKDVNLEEFFTNVQKNTQLVAILPASEDIEAFKKRFPSDAARLGLDNECHAIYKLLGVLAAQYEKEFRDLAHIILASYQANQNLLFELTGLRWNTQATTSKDAEITRVIKNIIHLKVKINTEVELFIWIRDTEWQALNCLDSLYYFQYVVNKVSAEHINRDHINSLFLKRELFFDDYMMASLVQNCFFAHHCALFRMFIANRFDSAQKVIDNIRKIDDIIFDIVLAFHYIERSMYVDVKVSRNNVPTVVDGKTRVLNFLNSLTAVESRVPQELKQFIHDYQELTDEEGLPVFSNTLEERFPDFRLQSTKAHLSFDEGTLEAAQSAGVNLLFSAGG